MAWKIFGVLATLFGLLATLAPYLPVGARDIMVFLAGALLLWALWSLLGRVFPFLRRKYPFLVRLRRYETWLRVVILVLGAVAEVAWFPTIRLWYAPAPELRIKIEEVVVRGYNLMIDDPTVTQNLPRDGYTVIEDTQSSAVVLIVRVENRSAAVASTAALHGFSVSLPNRGAILSASILVPPQMRFHTVYPGPLPITRATLFGSDYLLDRVQTTPLPPGAQAYGLLHFTAQHVKKTELLKNEAVYRLSMKDIRGQEMVDEYRGFARGMPSPRYYPGIRVEMDYISPAKPPRP
jgi:hypothetical protein